jgi:cytochrome c oxidase subunit 1
VIPFGVLLYNWIASLWGGTLRLRAAAWYALAAISTISFGLTGELAYSVIPVGWVLGDTTASQGDTLYVLVGAGVMGGFAALHYWFPKLSGRVLGEGLGKGALALMVVGIHLYVIPMFLAGLEGQPVDVFTYYSDLGVDGYNLIASIGAFLLVGGILLQLGNAARSWHNGIDAHGHDPWSGATLEWFALSPPPPHNFDAVPDVRSPEPLDDIREAVRGRTESWRPPPPLERVAAPAAEPSESGATAPDGTTEVEDREPSGGDGPSLA